MQLQEVDTFSIQRQRGLPLFPSWILGKQILYTNIPQWLIVEDKWQMQKKQRAWGSNPLPPFSCSPWELSEASQVFHTHERSKEEPRGTVEHNRHWGHGESYKDPEAEIHGGQGHGNVDSPCRQSGLVASAFLSIWHWELFHCLLAVTLRKVKSRKDYFNSHGQNLPGFD